MRVKYDSEHYRVEQLSKTDVKKMYPKRDLSPEAKCVRGVVKEGFTVVKIINKDLHDVELSYRSDVINELLKKAYRFTTCGAKRWFYLDLSKCKDTNAVTEEDKKETDEVIVAVEI